MCTYKSVPIAVSLVLTAAAFSPGLASIAHAQGQATPAAKAAREANVKPATAPGKDVLVDTPVATHTPRAGRLIATPGIEVAPTSLQNSLRAAAQARALANSLGEFGLGLMRHGSQAAGSATKNAVISPFSVANALGLLHAGAEGPTAAEIGNLLDATPARGRSYVLGLPGLIAQLGKDSPGVEWSVANQVWVGANAISQFSPAYSKTVTDRYKARGAVLDFNRAEPARQAINSWASEQTKGKISALMPAGSITPNTRFVLTNAVYFKGKWEAPFDSAATQALPFTGPDGKAMPVPTMVGVRNIRSGVVGNVTVYEVPYQGGAYALQLALPPAGHTLNALETDLSGLDVAGWSAQLTSVSCEIYLPKFKINPASDSLKPALIGLGMTTAFGPSANFGPMVGKLRADLHVDDIYHAATIVVDEEGSEASAATGVAIRAKSLPAAVPVCKVDRPFIFSVVHRASGTPVFMGKVSMPRID